MKFKILVSALLAVVCLSLFFQSCSKNDDLAYNTNSVTLDLSHNYQYNVGDADRATLGRVLFYDKSLSINNSISCGSCHKQSLAFADDVAQSPGFENFKGERNTPPIQNLGSFFTLGNSAGQALFWDGRERDLSRMVLQPYFNHVEMGVPSTHYLLKKIKSRPYYQELFKKAFVDGEINISNVSEALQIFIMNMQSFGSDFDKRFRATVMGLALSAQEQRGLDLFFNKYNCGSCHQLNSPIGYVPTASPTLESTENSELLNIGLDVVYDDKGLGAVTGNAEDDGKFKIPNLRNVALTAPYMHDGRFETLEEVIDHYSIGIQDNENLDFRLRNASGNPLVLNITQQEKDDLIVFLHSLTDRELISDPRLSDPFKKN